MIQYASLKEAWGLHGNGARVSSKTACARPSPDSADKDRRTPCCPPPQDPMEMLYNASKNGQMDVDGDFAAYYNDVKARCDKADAPADKSRAQCHRPELRAYEVPDPPSSRYSYVDARPVYPEKVVAPPIEGFGAGPCAAYGEDLPPELYDEYAKSYAEGVAKKHRRPLVDVDERPGRFRETFHETFEEPPYSAPASLPHAPVSSPLLSALLSAPVPRIVDALLYVFSGIVFIFLLEQAITLASVVRVAP